MRSEWRRVRWKTKSIFEHKGILGRRRSMVGKGRSRMNERENESVSELLCRDGELNCARIGETRELKGL
jgi:hypothetical protein